MSETADAEHFALCQRCRDRARFREFEDNGSSKGNYRHKYCQARRNDGEQCQALAVAGSNFCFSHDPALAERRQAAYQRGGRNRANIVRLRGLIPPRLVPVFDRLERALEEVHTGELDPKQASAMASLATAMVRVLTAGELEERVRRVDSKAETGMTWPKNARSPNRKHWHNCLLVGAIGLAGTAVQWFNRSDCA